MSAKGQKSRILYENEYTYYKFVVRKVTKAQT